MSCVELALFAVIAPLATCAVHWVHMRMRDRDSVKSTDTQAVPSSERDMNGGDTHIGSQQPPSSTVSTTAGFAPVTSNSDLHSSPDLPGILPSSSAPVSVSSSARIRGQSDGTPSDRTCVAAALSMLHAHSVPPAQPDVVQVEGIQMVAVGGSAARPGTSNAPVSARGVRPFSASSVPLTTLDGHRSNPLYNLQSVLCHHNMLTDVPEVCCTVATVCPEHLALCAAGRTCTALLYTLVVAAAT